MIKGQPGLGRLAMSNGLVVLQRAQILQIRKWCRTENFIECSHYIVYTALAYASNEYFSKDQESQDSGVAKCARSRVLRHLIEPSVLFSFLEPGRKDILTASRSANSFLCASCLFHVSSCFTKANIPRLSTLPRAYKSLK